MSSVRNLKLKFEAQKVDKNIINNNNDNNDEEERVKITEVMNSVPKVQNSNFLTLPPESESMKGTEYDAETTDSDLHRLKAMTARLNLTTQRPSFVEWRSTYFKKPEIVKSLQRKSMTPLPEERPQFPWTPAREREMGEAISWIRNELGHILVYLFNGGEWIKYSNHDEMEGGHLGFGEEAFTFAHWSTEMRHTDQNLARTLVALRHEIHTLKLEFSCQAHRMTIDDVHDELEDEDILNELSDSPLGIGALSPLAPLQKFGVTKLNFERRRFSLC